MQPSCDRPDWCSGGARAAPREAVRAPPSGPRGTPLAALLAVALDLARELVLAAHDRVVHVGRGGARAERDPLAVERGLGDLAVGDRRVALLAQLDLELSELGNLACDRPEAAIDMVPQSVGDRGVPSLDRDAHSAPPLRRVGWIFP